MRLTTSDASFLYGESVSSPMHISSVYILEGELPFENVFRHFAARLHLVPSYRRKLAQVPMNIAHPEWVDDTINARFTHYDRLPLHAMVGLAPDLAIALDAHFIGCLPERLREIRQDQARLVAAGAASLLTEETAPGPSVQTDAEIVDAFRTRGQAGYHACGTVAMGGADAPLDPQLCVRGVDNLRVVDGSILPTMVSANTNGPIMAMGWRAAQIILQGRNR